MFSVICSSPEVYEQVLSVLDGSIHYESTGIGNIKHKLEEAARVHASFLILDIDSGISEDIIAGVKKFRVARPGTRIILIAPGRAPGDSTINSLISKGVYDIVAPAVSADGEDPDISAALKKVLDSMPANYADAVRWDVAHDEEAPKVNKGPTVYLEKLVGTGHIVVGGARHGSGSTTLAIAVAEYLAGVCKKKVALIEMCRYPVLYSISGQLHKRVAPFLQINRFTLYLDEIKSPIEQVIGGKYDYIVMDMGALYEPELEAESREKLQLVKRHDYYSETTRADLVLFTLRDVPWSQYDLLPYLKNNTGIKNWTILTPAAKDTLADVKEAVGSKSVYQVPSIRNPFLRDAELDESLEEILSPILPQKTKNKISFWPFSK